MLNGSTFNVPFPRQTERTVATLLRGHRFGPIKDGWMIMFENNETPPSDRIVDQFCIVMPPDGPLKARIVRFGRRPGTWDLLTHTGDPELDQPLLWAELVTMILPYSPTPADIAALGAGYWEPVGPQIQNGRQAP